MKKIFASFVIAAALMTVSGCASSDPSRHAYVPNPQGTPMVQTQP